MAETYLLRRTCNCIPGSPRIGDRFAGKSGIEESRADKVVLKVARLQREVVMSDFTTTFPC